MSGAQGKKVGEVKRGDQVPRWSKNWKRNHEINQRLGFLQFSTDGRKT